MSTASDLPLGERFIKASKRAKKNAKRNAKKMLSSVEADKIPEQGSSEVENVLKPLQLGGPSDPLRTVDAAENRRDMALETKSLQPSPAAVSGSQREGEWHQDIISMAPKENLKVFDYGNNSSSDLDHTAQEMKSSEYIVQKDVIKAISATGQDMKVDVSSITGATPEATSKLFKQTFLEQCSIVAGIQAPMNSSKEGFFQPMTFAAEIVRLLPPGTLKPGKSQLPKIATQEEAIKKPKKVRKAPHPNCTKPQVWLADETITMPMPHYPELWVAPPPLPAEVPKRLVLTDRAKNFLLAQSPNCKIKVHLVDDYGFTSFSAPIRGPEGSTIVPEYLVSTATLRAMGFYMGAAEKIWQRYLDNAEKQSMEDEYTLLFYTQRFIEDTYTDAVVGSERVSDSDVLMEKKWGLVCELVAAIRREARAKDAAKNSWRPIIKITDLNLLKAQVTKKVSGKFRALDRLSYEIEKRATTKKAVSLTPMGDYVEEKGKARGMKFRANNNQSTTEVFAPLAKMLDYY